jgi:hypothetical protein
MSNSPAASKKDHHFVPQLHLKHFIGSQPPGHIWTYSKSSLNAFSSIPKETGFQRYFYGIRKDDGSIDNSIEDWLAEIEGVSAPIYQKLLEGDLSLSDKERTEFAVFLALMKLRSPAMRRIYADGFSKFIQIQAYARASSKQGFEEYIKQYQADTGETFDQAEKEEIRRDLQDMSRFVINIPQEQTLPALTAVNPLAEILFQMTWSIGYLNNGYFVTTDNPVIHDVDRTTVHPIYGGFNYKNKTCQAIFPLSHKKILFLSWGATSCNFEIPKSYSEQVNKALIAQSENFVYSHIKHKEITKLVEQLKNEQQRFEISGFGPKKFAATKIKRNWKK